MKNLRCPFCGGVLLLRQFDGYEGYDTYYVGELEDELDKQIDTIPFVANVIVNLVYTNQQERLLRYGIGECSNGQ